MSAQTAVYEHAAIEVVETEHPVSRRRVRWSVHIARVVTIVALLGSWEFASGRWLDPLFVSRPSDFAAVWWEWLTDGTLWYHGVSTFWSFAIGFTIGGVAALVLGYLFGSSAWIATTFSPFITGFYSIPKLALIPLLIMWFGLGRQLEVVICALVVFFVMFYNTFYGIKDVDRSLIDAVRVMGAKRRHLALQVKLPSALVWVVAGFKISVPQGLIAVVVAEILASNRGLGHLVTMHASQFDSAGTFAAIFTLLIVGIAVDSAVGLLTKRALVWKEGGTAEP